MGYQRIGGLDAYQTAMGDPLSKWPSRGVDNNRLYPRCLPGFSPSFSLDPCESIFTHRIVLCQKCRI